jgi:hypothetical protein
MSISDIRRRVEKATSGPWDYGYWSTSCAKPSHARGHPGVTGSDPCVYDQREWAEPYAEYHVISSRGTPGREVAGAYDYDCGGIIHEADAEFIRRARTDVPLLLDVAEAARDLLHDGFDADPKTASVDALMLSAAALRAALLALDAPEAGKGEA